MELLSPNFHSEDEEENRMEQILTVKKSALLHFSDEIKQKVSTTIDEIVCDILFEILEQQEGVFDMKRLGGSLMAIEPVEKSLNSSYELRVEKGKEMVQCPKCGTQIKCLWLTRHLEECMQLGNSQGDSRSSSRVARRRIQEGLKATDDDAIDDSDDGSVKPKRRNTGRKKNNRK